MTVLSDAERTYYEFRSKLFFEAKKGITYMRKINTEPADAYKELLYLIYEIIVASDGVIAKSEVDEVKRLKAMCE